ncbi:STAS domain-containing protein [bacterium]|nr:STAS domain-containing protein [bacterium]
MEGIQVSVEKVGPQSDISIIRVGGYIDTTTSSELERALDSLLKAGVFRIIIDLGNVDYISSAGWGIFISEIKGIRERGGDLKLSKMIPDVYEVFELLEFNYILKAFDTIEDAIRSFDKEQGIIEPEEKIIDEKEQTDTETDHVEVEEEEELDDSITLDDKVEKVAVDNPSWGPLRISKELNTEKYGFMKVGTITVWRILRKLNLGSKKKRVNLNQEE